jgi:hypothetical protein
MRGLKINSNSLYTHVYYSFPMYYFNIKKRVYLIDIGKREEIGKREKE